MTLEELSTGDARMAAFEAAPCETGLPTEDLEDAGQHFFACAEAESYGGFCRRGSIALLRSIVVAPSRQRQGIGAALLDALLREARAAGATQAWLLTTTASGFFARHGFLWGDRSLAPPAVAATAQFSALCPSSAVLMCRTLA
ncbi:MAG TPA: arsenic resistance N-acetyltransferase ArsN2 [Stellaceae bacterium]|nr:arsenic resistance N-acetyltransferase ArsN2 [Stellaceae bacterium]